MNGKFYIYYYENKINGKMYIGEGHNNRMYDHMNRAFMNSTKDEVPNFYRALRKYGIDNFIYGIVKFYDTKEESLFAEEDMIAFLKSLGVKLYNILDGGRKGRSGLIASEETRRKISIAHTGMKHTEKAKDKMRKRMTGSKGTNTSKILDDEWRKNIALSRNGKENILKRKFNKNQELDICKLYEIDNYSMTKISKIYNCSRTLITDTLIRNNIKLIDVQIQNRPKKFTEAIELEIYHKYKIIKNKRELVRLFKCANRTIDRITRKYESLENK